MRSVTINPSRMCQPIGAMHATLGIHAAVPLIHGSQGCSAYPMRMFNRHFREPAQIAVTALGEGASVFGGRDNLIASIKNVIARRNPELIGVITTCLSETIGDDVEGIVRETIDEIEEVEEKDVIPIVTIHTPSYVGSHITGYDNALKAFVTHLSKEVDESDEKLNIIPGMINPGDIREIKGMLDLLGVSYTILSDISDTFDAPIILPKPSFPNGGTSVAEIEKCAGACGVISLCEHAGGSAAKFLKGKYGMRSDAICPIGVSKTDRFIEAISDITEKEIPYELEKERGKLIDAMVDVHQLTYGKKAAIFADPDIALGIAEFASELGMEVVVLASSTSSNAFMDAAKEISDGEILNGNDLYDLHRAVKEKDADILFGHTMCKKSIPTGEDNIAFVRCGFPVYDRIGYYRYGIMGYHGGIYLSDLIANAILDRYGQYG